MTSKKIILITGGAGFIGSNYLNMMVPKYPEYHFVNLDALTYAANQANISVSAAPNYSFEQADIRDKSTLEIIFKKHQPTHVINFAAESHVDNSIAGPGIFIETNILGTHNLLLLAKEYNIVRFQQISTDEVYGSLSHDASPSTEADMHLPNSPYSASKASADLLVRSYHETFGLDTVITRASNNYGPNQFPEKLIPLFISKLLSGNKVPLYGDGLNVRDWIHVDDHVHGIDAVFHKGKAGEIYNLGGGNEIKNVEITKTLIALAGQSEDAIEHVTDRLGHDQRYALDSGKAKRELGWEPERNFTEGIKETFEFYTNLKNKAS